MVAFGDQLGAFTRRRWARFRRGISWLRTLKTFEAMNCSRAGDAFWRETAATIRTERASPVASAFIVADPAFLPAGLTSSLGTRRGVSDSEPRTHSPRMARLEGCPAAFPGSGPGQSGQRWAAKLQYLPAMFGNSRCRRAARIFHERPRWKDRPRRSPAGE